MFLSTLQCCGIYHVSLAHVTLKFSVLRPCEPLEKPVSTSPPISKCLSFQALPQLAGRRPSDELSIQFMLVSGLVFLFHIRTWPRWGAL